MTTVDHTPKYPDVTVQLTGRNGNAFAILAAVMSALTDAGHPHAAVAFREEATSGDYDHLLTTAMRYVDVL